MAGNGIRAYYQFPGGFAADFESYEGDHDRERPYRIDIHGTEGTISLPGPLNDQPDIYFHPRVAPRLFDDDRWQVIPAEPPPDDHKWVNAHHRMAKAMIDRIEGREPEYELLEGSTARRHVEWAMAAHAAHMAGARGRPAVRHGAQPVRRLETVGRSPVPNLARRADSRAWTK